MEPHGETKDNDNPYASPLTDASLSGGTLPSGDSNMLGPPTQARQWVIVFAVTLAVITYIDRVCISQAAPHIKADLGLNNSQMALVFAAFSLAYSLFEIPGGWLGDWIGPRKVLMRVVVMWSIFTAATGWAWNIGSELHRVFLPILGLLGLQATVWAWSMGSLLVCRFLFGAGEAGCFPNLTKAFTIWLPHSERVRAQGIMWLSARWGGAFTPMLVVAVFAVVSWRWGFVIFGAIGVVWAILFYRWFRDNPQDHPAVNAAELKLLEGGQANLAGHGKVPWLRFLSSGTVWMLWLQYFCMAYGWYFYITWLPTYLQQVREVPLAKSAFLAGLPLFFGGLGSFFGGLVSRRLETVLGSTARVRRVMAYVGFTAAGVMLVLSTQIQSPTLAMISMGLASFANDLAMPGAWGACMDVGGKYAGSLAGSMNMMGNLGGVVCPLAVAYILDHTNNNWNITFWVAGAAYWLGGLTWYFIDPVTPLDQEAA